MADLATPAIDLGIVAPGGIVALTGVLVMLLSVLVPRTMGGLLAAVSLVGLGLALAATVALFGQTRQGFHGMIVADGSFVFFGALALVLAGLAVLLAQDYLTREGLMAGEYFTLVLFSTVGALVLAGSVDLLSLVLGLEVLSIAFYVLAGFARGRLRSEEAALKYFLLGAFSLGFMVYGAALVYGATGSTSFDGIALSTSTGPISPLLYAGLALLLVGFAFKLSLVPFHLWTPDVYEGAPVVSVAYMAAATKVAVLAVLLRMLTTALPSLAADWRPVLWGLAMLTMILGNIAALAQTNVKRLLAYSSIAQAGYILVAIVGGGELGTRGAMLYVAAYVFMVLGAFAVVTAVSRTGDEGVGLSDFAGLARRSPLLAGAMALFLFSLAGIPPTGGFTAKLYAFSAALASGYVDLAIVGVLTSAIALLYYLRVIVLMYMREAPAEAPQYHAGIPAALAVVVVVAVLFTLQMGIVPGLTLGLAGASAPQVVVGR